MYQTYFQNVCALATIYIKQSSSIPYTSHLPNKQQYSHSVILSTKLEYMPDTEEVHPSNTAKFGASYQYSHAFKVPITTTVQIFIA